MLAESRKRILGSLEENALVLDVGGWAHPLSRADWVIDLMPFETRGLYGDPDPDPSRFSAESWIQRDICDAEPWPFSDDQFDFVVCSHTLEDVRDPVRVCAEMSRVGKAGYVEVPARSEEQTYGVHGPWVGWSHHHWLINVEDAGLEFVFKPHLLHGRSEFWVPLEWTQALVRERRVSTFFWEGSISGYERVFYEPEDLHRWLLEVGPRHGAPVGVPASAGGPEGVPGIRASLRRLIAPKSL